MVTGIFLAVIAQFFFNVIKDILTQPYWGWAPDAISTLLTIPLLYLTIRFFERRKAL